MAADQGELICERDGVATRLTCVECHTPICTKCLVRTPVGMKCETHGAGPGGVRGLGRGGRGGTLRKLAPLVVLVLVALVIALPRLMSSDDAGPDLSALDVPVGGGPIGVGPARAGPMGVEVRDADLAFTVASFECGVTLPRPPQGRFCVLNLDLRNVGRSAVTFEAGRQALIDTQNRNFRADLTATAEHLTNAGRDLGALLVNPGNQVTAAIVFDLPPDVTPNVVALRATSGVTAAFVSLRSRPSG